MSTHLITIVIPMEDMDGTPEQSAEILMSDPQILHDYIDNGAFEVTDAEEKE